MFAYAEKLAVKLPETENQKLLAHMKTLLCPRDCWVKFLKPAQQTEALVPHETDDEDDANLEVPSGPLAEVKEGFNRATGLLLDLLVQLMSFRYMSDLQDIASSCGSLVKALQQAEDQALVDSKEYKMPELVKQIRLITQQFDGNSKSVAVSASAPAPSLLNSLTSHGTDVPDADGERERHWKTVQGERKRFVSFSVPKTWTSDGLGGAFRSAGKVFNHSGTLNSSHRLIVASADLLHEEGDEPWLSLQSPASNLWKDIVTFCSSASGNTDFVMLFDGRMRQIRRTNESWLS